jgi:hypothetical protein
MSISDHCYSKNLNNHKLLPACRRCQLLFANEERLKEHDILLQSDSGCPKLGREERRSRNTSLKRGRITEKKAEKIEDALKAFKREKELPKSCTPEFLEKWLHANLPHYVGESSIDPDLASVELSKWLVVFCTLFPRDQIPMNPCKLTAAFCSTDCEAYFRQS